VRPGLHVAATGREEAAVKSRKKSNQKKLVRPKFDFYF
jgi:hypothetical protein